MMSPFSGGISAPKVPSWLAPKFNSVNAAIAADKAESVSESPTDYNFLEYLEGLFSSQGAENEINRKYNSAEAALNREFQSNEARIQREWYEQMSNSSYQRAVADMKAAGINPILAFSQGGASSAGTGMAAGSAAQYNATGGDRVSDIMNGLANLIASISSARGNGVETAFKLFKMAGG